MKKSIFRVLSFALVLLMMFGMLASCGGGDDNNGGDNGKTPGGANELRYDGEQIDVLGRSKTNVKEYIQNFEDAAGQSVEESIYYRNVYTTDSLNITTVWNEVEDSGYVSDANISHQAGGTYDVFCCYSLTASTLAMSGILKNLKTYEFMDMNAEWYPDKLIEDATIFDKLYFVSGDVSTNNIFMSSLIYYNKDLYETNQIASQLNTKYGYESIYDFVRDGKWTFEVMFELSTNIWEDTDKTGEYSLNGGDTYGFATYQTLYDNFYYGAGLTTITSDPINGLKLSDDFKNADKITNIITDVNNFLTSIDGYTSGDTHIGARTAFAESRVLFYMAPATHAYTTFRNVDGLTYGVLPVPKYSADQDGYLASPSLPYSMYGVASLSSDPEIAAAYIHILGKFSYEKSRPVFFDETMKLKYAENVDDSEMWDMVIDSQTQDLGKVFSNQIGSGAPTINLFRQAIAAGSSNWASQFSSNAKSMNSSITALNASLKALE